MLMGIFAVMEPTYSLTIAQRQIIIFTITGAQKEIRTPTQGKLVRRNLPPTHTLTSIRALQLILSVDLALT